MCNNYNKWRRSSGGSWRLLWRWSEGEYELIASGQLGLFLSLMPESPRPSGVSIPLPGDQLTLTHRPRSRPFLGFIKKRMVGGLRATVCFLNRRNRGSRVS